MGLEKSYDTLPMAREDKEMVLKILSLFGIPSRTNPHHFIAVDPNQAMNACFSNNDPSRPDEGNNVKSDAQIRMMAHIVNGQMSMFQFKYSTTHCCQKGPCSTSLQTSKPLFSDSDSTT
jgi:hypothetical protein